MCSAAPRWSFSCLQLVTGILLALLYVPSAGEAWNSLQTLNHHVTLGWFIRALHGWGSNFMVAIVLIHMVQVFLFGAYKFPRELTWVVGVFLLLMTLGMAFTGQVLRFDQDAYWGLGIGASIASRVPVMGPCDRESVAGRTDHRRRHAVAILRAACVRRFPGLLIGFVGVHLLMVLKLGINEWPMPGRVVRRATYVKEYHELTHKDGIPFVPSPSGRTCFFAGDPDLVRRGCAAYFGPFGPSGQPDPTIIQTAPRPDYFFLWLYAVLALLPPSMETPALLIGPVVVIGGLLLLPFVFGEGEKSWKRRPVAVSQILLIAVSLGTFTHLAELHAVEPGHGRVERRSDSYGGFWNGRTPLERQGALVFQAKQCHNCHSLGDEGGLRGPALDSVAVRLTRDQLIRQVIQGGGNMPAYGKNLTPPQTTALVAFLETLKPAGQPAARNASEALAGTSSATPQSAPTPKP